MAVKACTSITLFHNVDIIGTTYYYKLVTTLTTPNVPDDSVVDPTTSAGGSWSTSEPAYTSGSTSYLYYTIQTKFSDGTQSYSYANIVSGNRKACLSSSYEAAKEAYNKAYATEQNLDNYIAKRDIIVGTQTAATRFWTGVSQLDSLQDGDEIYYWIPYAGKAENGSNDKTVGIDTRISSSSVKTVGTKINSWENTTSSSANSRVWLNLTLKNGTQTGWIACYYSGTTRLTTHYGAGNCIHLTFRLNAYIAGSAVTNQYTGWWADGNYDSGNTNYYDRIRFQNAIIAKSAITAETLIVSDDTGYFKLVAGSVFNLDKPILWAGSAISANTTGTNNYIMFSTVNLTKNISGISLTNRETVYLKGTVNGNIFTVDSETPFTTTKPTTNDDKYYILLGLMYSTTNFGLFPEHPIYKYVKDGFKNVSQVAYEAQGDVDKARSDLSGEINSKTRSVQDNLDNLSDHLDDKVLDMIRNIDSTGFVLTTSQPSDWTTKYTNYYIHDEQNKKYVRLEESETPPTWQADKYYKNSNTLSQAMFNINDTRFDFKWSDQATQDELRQSVNALLNEKNIDNLNYISADQGVLWFGNAQSKYKLAIDNDGIDILYNNIIQSFWNTERFDTAGLAMGNRDGVWKEFAENAYKIANGFTKITSQPSNWSTKYTNYYVKADVSGKWCIKVTGSSAPAWDNDMYYSYSGTPTITGKRYRIWRFMYVPNSNGSLSFRRVETFSIEEVTN